MTTIEYIDALKARYGLRSEYAVAKFLNVTTSTSLNWRHGKSHFEDEMALRVAELLDLEPSRVLADMHAQRAKSENVRAAWLKIAEGATAVFLYALAAVILSAAPAPAEASARGESGLLRGAQSGMTVHYVNLAQYLKSAARRLAARARPLFRPRLKVLKPRKAPHRFSPA